MRFQSYFNTAVGVINAFKGDIPLAHYLKQYFAQHKKHGSKDRKYISHLCYCYYRLGHALKSISTEERLKIALFLCNDVIDEWAVLFNDDWLNNHSALLDERIAFIKSLYPFDVLEIFPWQTELSEGMDTYSFARSHLIQPDLFLRIRPGNKNIVSEKLKQAHIGFKEVSNSCFALPNISKVDTLIGLNKEAVVQDYSSQNIQVFFDSIGAQHNSQAKLSVWDCCAASGGKSILAYDILQNIELTVSDIRPSIIHNLQQRFSEAGIKNYKSFIADLTDAKTLAGNQQYDVIICDAPCTGSGTWSRTPEQLYFFSDDKMEQYAALQKKIVQTVVPHIKEHGYFLYITCSVFKKENEEMVAFIQQQYGFRLVQKELLVGYDKKADSMFGVLFGGS